jgi:acetyl esterase
MPLDPQARAVLDQMAAMGVRPIHQVGVERSREMMIQRAKIMNANPLPVARVEERKMAGPGGQPLTIRFYWPDAPGPLPILVYYHGGGWVQGNLDTHDGQARNLANGAGCLVASVDYRLAPEWKFPDAVEDCYAALGWVADHAGELGGDPSRIAVGGDSAGGNQAAVVSILARDRSGPKLAFQLLVYPVTDYSFETVSYRENAEGYGLETKAMQFYWDRYLPRPEDGANPLASPMRADDLSGLPPALVLTAEFDPLLDEGEAYAEKLRAAGVPVTLNRYDGMIHGFFGMSRVVDKARQAVDDASAALRKAFSGVAV